MKIVVKIPKVNSAYVSIEVEGVEGKGCLAKTVNLRRNLVAASPVERKPEFDRDVVEVERCLA